LEHDFSETPAKGKGKSIRTQRILLPPRKNLRIGGLKKKRRRMVGEDLIISKKSSRWTRQTEEERAGAESPDRPRRGHAIVLHAEKTTGDSLAFNRKVVRRGEARARKYKKGGGHHPVWGKVLLSATVNRGHGGGCGKGGKERPSAFGEVSSFGWEAPVHEHGVKGGKKSLYPGPKKFGLQALGRSEGDGVGKEEGRLSRRSEKTYCIRKKAWRLISNIEKREIVFLIPSRESGSPVDSVQRERTDFSNCP